MITSARYLQDGSILATINGVEMTIPDDLGNRHRQIVEAWENDGNSILAYVAPEAGVNPSIDYTPLLDAMVAEGAITAVRRVKILARLQG